MIDMKSDADATAPSKRLARVACDPRYQTLVKRRGRFTWALTCVISL